MLTKRIIPCMDIKEGRVVKGTKFVELRDAGNPLALAVRYNAEGADEVSFLDITASAEGRKTTVSLMKRVAERLFIPFSVGGGISTLEDARVILAAGAEKVSIGTAAVKNPEFVAEAARMFGSQAVVVSIDAKKRSAGKWAVFIKGGREDTGIDVVSFVKQMEKRGAGEILLNSIDADGMKCGFDIPLTRAVSEAVSIPIIASGGAGTLEDFAEVFIKGKADAALAASVFHYGTYTLRNVKLYLQKQGIAVRL